MNPITKFDRRTFLKTSGGFIAISFALPHLAWAQDKPELPGDLEDHPMLNAWIQVNADGTVTLLIGKVELGQGAVTAIAQVAAEELVIAFDRLKVVSGDTLLSPDEGTTAGSQSMPNSAPGVQQAAAEVRQIMRNLAAAKLGQPADGLKIADGTLTAPDGASVTYWDLVAGLDLAVEATGKAPLLPKEEYRIIGTNVPRLDIPAKMTGQPIFVQELQMEGMLYGAVARPPNYRSKLVEVDLAPIEAMAGVRKVVRNGSFLAVIAVRQEQAWAAAAALTKSAKWDVPSDLPGSDGIFDWLQGATSIEKEVHLKERTDGAAVAGTVAQTYLRPYHMHGSIGTSAAVAKMGDDGTMTVWTHSQSVWATAAAIEQLLGLAEGKCHAIHTQGAGCYGHNNADDAAADAALLAAALPGSPVKLQYIRADEHKWEPYGSAMVNKLTADVDADGNVLKWEHHIYSTSHGTRPGGDAGNLLAGRLVDPPFEQPVPSDGGPPNYAAARNGIALYEFPGQRVVTHFVTEMPVRVSSTRGLGAYANVMAIEQFIDELARAAKADPVEYRLRYLKDPRARDVLTACAEKFGWSSFEKGRNRGRGIAFAQYKNYAALTAVAVEVSVTPRNGRVNIVRAVAANDSGQMVSPDGIANQIEGGMTQSFSWTLKEEVKFDTSQILSSDWASYPIITFSEVPPIDLVLIDRPGEHFLGTGESAQGPSGAALANAIADAIGARVRQVPFTPDRVMAAIPA